MLDLAVLVILFVRPDDLRKCLEPIRQAKPARLYFYQDGPRPDVPSDAVAARQCRDIIAEMVDWDCEVHTQFKTENKGAWLANYSAIKWMFQTEEMGVILEDDDIIDPSFLLFCQELLERYRTDLRVSTICAMNHLDVYKPDYADYIFTRFQSIWGWATWKRVVDAWDETHSYFQNPYICARLKSQCPEFAYRRRVSRQSRETGIPNYEMLAWGTQVTQNMMNIVPTRNLVSNIGIGAGNANCGAHLRQHPRIFQKLFFKQRYELAFPLRHPPYVLEDAIYTARANRILAFGHPLVDVWRKIETSLRRFVFSSSAERWEKVRRLPKTYKYWLSSFRTR